MKRPSKCFTCGLQSLGRIGLDAEHIRILYTTLIDGFFAPPLPDTKIYLASRSGERVYSGLEATKKGLRTFSLEAASLFQSNCFVSLKVKHLTLITFLLLDKCIDSDPLATAQHLHQVQGDAGGARCKSDGITSEREVTCESFHFLP